MFDLRVLGGILLVAGTTIGAGMLALPVVTAFTGFIPAIILFIAAWLILTYAAFLLLEVNLAMPEHTNVITMAKRTLGRGGEIVGWISYLLLLYSLTAAYISGCGAILVHGVDTVFGVTISDWIGPIPFVIFFGVLIFFGIRPIDYINRFFMIALAVSFIALVGSISSDIEVINLVRFDFGYLFTPAPVVITAFGFSILVPSLVNYLQRDVRKIKIAILVGSLIPLVVYIIWELSILGVIPLEGDYGLRAMYASGEPAGDLMDTLQLITNNPWITGIAIFFSFFAIVTSVLGVTLSLSDFLLDGLQVDESASGRLLITLLTLLPPLVYAWSYPSGFIIALGYAAIFVAILLGIIPALMVWSKRYRRHYEGYTAKGGKLALLLLMAAFVFVIVLELGENFISKALFQ